MDEHTKKILEAMANIIELHTKQIAGFIQLGRQDNERIMEFEARVKKLEEVKVKP